jgi:hypothetical protein
MKEITRRLISGILEGRTDLLLEFNRGWVDNLSQRELLSVIYQSYIDKNVIFNEDILTEIHRRKYDTKKHNQIVRELSVIIDGGYECPEDILDRMNREFQALYIERMISKISDPNMTHEIRLQTIMDTNTILTGSTSISLSSDLEETIQEFKTDVESGKTDMFIKRAIKIEDKALKVLFGEYIYPQPITITALPGRYKTSLLISLLASIPDAGIYFSIEDSKFVLRNKFISCMYGIPKNELKTIKPDLKKVTKSDKRISVYDKAMTPIEMQAIIEGELVRNPEIKWVALDYLQIIKPEARQSRYDKVNQMLDVAREMCKKHHIAFIILSQAPKQESDYGILGTGDSKESGAVDEVARWQFSLNWKENEPPWKLLWNCYKGEGIYQRNVDFFAELGKVKYASHIK